jgi:hypothetical protein
MYLALRLRYPVRGTQRLACNAPYWLHIFEELEIGSVFLVVDFFFPLFFSYLALLSIHGLKGSRPSSSG